MPWRLLSNCSKVLRLRKRAHGTHACCGYRSCGGFGQCRKGVSISGEIHRLRDMANKWPILVRVTTANAMVLGTVDPQQKTDDGSS